MKTKPIKELPSPPRNHWLRGHWPTLTSPNAPNELHKLSKQYSGIFRLRATPFKAVVISDSDLIKQVLKSRPTDFRRFSGLETGFGSIGMNGLFTSEGEHWKYQRQLTAPSFKTQTLKASYPCFVKIADRLVDRCKEIARSGEPVDFKRLMNQYTADLLCNVILGFDTYSLDSKQSALLDNLAIVFPGLNRRIFCTRPLAISLLRSFNYKQEKEFENAIAYIRTFLTDQIQQAREQIEADPRLRQYPQNVIQSLIVEGESNPERFSDNDIISNIVTIFLAGIDTTANTIIWTIYLLCTHPERMQELQTSLNAINPNEFNQWPQPKVPMLTACIHESMRVKPTTPLLVHEPIHDVDLGGYHIPARTPIILLLHSVGMSPTTFPLPEQFEPKRWLEPCPAKVASIMPFGDGPRICPGRAMALTEIQLALFRILRAFDLEVIEPDNVQDQFLFVVEPDQLNIRINERQPITTVPIKQDNPATSD